MSRIDIKSEREFFREIFDKIVKGKYAIPVFQRDFVWKPTQIIDFFDSIWRGYPIGSIILWQPDLEMPVKDILTDKIGEIEKPEYFVLDGRQRLTAFFGCVYDSSYKDSRFDLYFNLDNETFAYNRNDKHNYIKVSDAYDTFIMLNIMQDFASDPTKEKAKSYVDRAKKLNAILQGYVVGEIYINNCSLREAEKVFSRINSEGTKISKSDMLQAITYNRNGVLLSEEIKNIQTSLEPYGFRTLAQEDILNCFYKFIDKNFYDAKLEDLEVMDFASVIPNIKECIVKSVRFLHDKCYVLSLAILPYIKQLIALTWFFRLYSDSTSSQVYELQKWFMYTTYAKVFQNGSLTNVRKIYRRFEEYLLGRSQTAIDYNYLEPFDFSFKFSLRNASSDFLLIALLRNYMRCVENSSILEYVGVYTPVNPKSPEWQIVLLSKADKSNLMSYFMTEVEVSDDDLKRYVLNNKMLNSVKNLDFSGFEYERKRLLYTLIDSLLEEYDLQVEYPIA